jgi:pyruvate dehydrogenase E2 component (dihydrolipoamide acetyltransferase)
MAEIRMPQLGETVTEGTITRWFKHVGDAVAEDEVLFEVSTEKVDTEVPSPAAGVLTEILVNEGDTVDVGTVLARVGEGEASASGGGEPSEEPAPAPASEPPRSDADQARAEGQPSATAPFEPADPAPADDAAPAPAPVAETTDNGEVLVLSPVVRRLIADHDLDPAAIEGTGLGGRITRADVERAVQERRPSGRAAPEAPRPAASPAPAAPQPTARSAAPRPRTGTGETREPLNRIRKMTGQHMVASKQTSPHVLTAIEVDFENVDRVRRRHRDAWKAEEGFSLTYLPFISRALSTALREYPAINASVDGSDLVIHNEVNLAIAVDVDFEGLLAPVVHDIDSKRMRAIAREIVDLANRARSKQLKADEVMGGTFTITNPGQYGTLMQFPIINQPQVAILSTDGVRRKPVVVTDEYGGESIAIHSVGVLAMAWDHRAFDGAYAAAFLNRLREVLETHDWDAELA